MPNKSTLSRPKTPVVDYFGFDEGHYEVLPELTTDSLPEEWRASFEELKAHANRLAKEYRGEASKNPWKNYK